MNQKEEIKIRILYFKFNFMIENFPQSLKDFINFSKNSENCLDG